MSVNGLAFNSLTTYLAAATDKGYVIYGVNPDLQKKISIELDGGVGIGKLFENTNMIVLVGGGDKPFRSKDTLVLRDQKKNQNVTEIDMRENIKNALIGDKKIIAVLENKVCLFDWEGNNPLTRQTYQNEKGLCVADSKFETVVTLGTKKGEIAVWKLSSDKYSIINAHKTNVESICINTTGEYVATASETGTLIRVFNTESGKQEYELRRGSNSASIYDITFNNDTTLLACCSSNGTVHIFELNNDTTTKNTQSMLSGFKNYLPKYFGSQWGFKQININNMSKSICSFDRNNDLHIVTFDDNYYKIPGATKNYDTLSSAKLHIVSE
jgi:WD repeat-containing protein 45